MLRSIQHPAFRNMLREQAEAHLAGCPVYEALFRPSTRGTDHLTISWKIGAPAAIGHIDGEERDKEGLAPSALGRRLELSG